LKKSKDISKFDIDWQMFRLSLKKLPSYLDKMEAAADYLLSHKDKATKERVLNYLEGLSLAYKGSERQNIVDLMSDFKELEVTSDNPKSSDFNKYDKKSLTALARDLWIRTKKWLDKGYRHEEQIEFLRQLYTYVGDSVSLDRLENAVEDSMEIPNTHKFMF
jgi:hypothetical protein